MYKFGAVRNASCEWAVCVMSTTRVQVGMHCAVYALLTRVQIGIKTCVQTGSVVPDVLRGVTMKLVIGSASRLFREQERG